MKTKNVILSDVKPSEIGNYPGKTKSFQYHPIFEGKSTFEMTIERNKSLADNLMVIGRIDNFKDSRDVISKLRIFNYEEIIEAYPKNTAAAAAFAAFESEPEDVLLITPSDQMIIANKQYFDVIENAKKIAISGHLVIIGLIQANEDKINAHSIEIKQPNPVREGSKMGENYNFRNLDLKLVNSGIYCFRAQDFLDELKDLEPDLYYSVKKAHLKKSGGFINEILNDLIPEKSLECVILTRSSKVKVLPAEFNWYYDMNTVKRLKLDKICGTD
jgi:mannose-1-phosphate guanylyltransferase